MAKRKMDNSSFQDRSEANYLFTNIKGRPVCPVCGANVAVTKEYYLRGHYETKHYENCKDLDVKQKLQKVQKMKRSLVSQQTMFIKKKSKSEAAVKASFIVATEIAKSGPFMRESLSKSAWSKFATLCAQIKSKIF